MLIVFQFYLIIYFPNVNAQQRETCEDYNYTDDYLSFQEEKPFNKCKRISFKNIESESYSLDFQILPNTELRTTLRDPVILWKDGVVPYNISEKFDSWQKCMIEEAAREFKEKTCVSFVPQSNQRPLLLIEPGKGCDTDIGKISSQANVVSNFARGCFRKGILMHEMMHALGFIHEHNRPDRDKYIKIIESNVMKEQKTQFTKYTWQEVESFNFSYDYGSIMHYDAYAFAIDPDAPTIVTLSDGVEIGQRSGFSNVDILKINRLYNCSKLNFQ